MLAAGTRVAGYVIEGVLGEGGMGVVYEASQPALQRRVALKVIDPRLASDPAFVTRFEREAIAQASIAHPHIVPVYEIGETADGLFLAMQLIRGPTLKDLITAGTLAPTQSIELLIPVADAIDAAHAAGLVHRDVKPQNVLVSTDWHPFLTDFGITKAAGGPSLTGAGAFIGTAAYAAPEQINGASSASSDIYSLAATLYECLTARLPFPAVTTADALRAHLDDPPPRPTALRPELPVAVDTVIVRALAKDPHERPASAVALIADAARALRNGGDVTAPAFDRPTAVTRPEETPAETRERRSLLSRTSQSYSAFLEQTLGAAMRLELSLELDPDQTRRPSDRVLPTPRRSGGLAGGTALVDVLERAGGVTGDGLLVLGAPGAGKTTLAVELAAALSERAHRDSTQPVPVYLPLSTRELTRGRLSDWIVDQLHKLYKVTPAAGWRALDPDGAGLVLVLDGLDEIADYDARAACAKEINAFASEYPVAVVVTSRRAEYELLPLRLELETAVHIRPLHPLDVLEQLRRTYDAQGVVAVIEQDQSLLDLLTSPLLVSMLTVAYGGRDAADIPLSTPSEQHLEHLIDDYLNRRYEHEARTSATPVPYSLERTRHWLHTLAAGLAANGQTIFLLERLRADQLPSRRAAALVRASPKVAFGFGSGLITAAVSAELSALLDYRELAAVHVVPWLLFGIVAAAIDERGAVVRVLAWTLLGMFSGVSYALLIDITDVEGLLAQGLYYAAIFLLVGELLVRLVPPEPAPAERLSWSWSRARPYIVPGLAIGMIGGPIFGLTFSLSLEAQGASVSGRSYWFFLFGPLFGLLWVFSRGVGRGLTAAPKTARHRPNEGIRESTRHGLVVGITTLVVIDALALAGFGVWALFNPSEDLGLEFAMAMLMATGWGTGCGLLLGIASGGGAAIQHWTLRLVLWRLGLAPLRYAGFLAFTVHLRLLYWGVGGGHMFIHKVVQDHFAERGRTP